MLLQYSISEKEALEYQLFVASNSKSIKQRRFRNRYLIPVIYIAFAVILFMFNSLDLSIGFLIMSILWYFIFPIWENNYYIKYYSKYLKEHFKNSYNKTIILEFKDDYMKSTSSETETKVNYSQISSINEIPNAIYLNIKSGHSYIIPKIKINNLDEFKQYIIQLSKQIEIPYEINDSWRWK